MQLKIHNFTNLGDYIRLIETMLDYLEKASGDDLGDFTTEGKRRNAGYNNYTIYWEWYKQLGYGSYQKQPYCACFVSTTLVSAYGLEKAKKLLGGDLFIYCPTGYTRFKNKGRIYSTPAIGDVVFFWNNSLGRWAHTGMVVAVDANGKGYTTIEANTSAGKEVVRNGGSTCRKHYLLTQTKVAFGRPCYEDCGISLNVEPTNNNGTHNGPSLQMYPIGTAETGLVCTVDALNVREIPGAGGTIKFKLTKDEKVSAEVKTFVNGSPWFYIKNSKGDQGWCSATCLEGWVQEKTADNKWWFLLHGYKYYVNTIKCINEKDYFFDASGFMFTGRIVFETDESGALKRVEE